MAVSKMFWCSRRKHRRKHIVIFLRKNSGSERNNYKDVCSTCICWLWLLVFVRWCKNGWKTWYVMEVCFKTLTFTPTLKIKHLVNHHHKSFPLCNEDDCNETSSTKISTFLHSRRCLSSQSLLYQTLQQEKFD